MYKNRLTCTGAAAEGDIGRDVGWGVGCVDGCLLLAFFRDVSVPLASDRLGDPGRLRVADAVLFFNASVCFGRPDGVFVPLVDAPDSFFTLSSSACRSSSFNRSASVSSELYISQGQHSALQTQRNIHTSSSVYGL